MEAYVIVRKNGRVRWPPKDFTPTGIARTTRIVPFRAERHSQSARYFVVIRPERGKRIVVFDGLGITMHRLVAQVYWMHHTSRDRYNEAAFVRWEKNHVRNGGIFPLITVMVGSASYPKPLKLAELLHVLRLIHPNGSVVFRTTDVRFEVAARLGEGPSPRKKPPRRSKKKPATRTRRS